MNKQRDTHRHPAMPIWFLGRPGHVYLPRYGRRQAGRVSQAPSS
jgi:hypothetical protein